MHKELDDALCKDFPITCRKRSLSKRESCMGRGFEVRDGWEPLVRRVAAFIEFTANNLRKAGTPDDKLPCFGQVKEKWGALRIYVDYETPEIQEVIAKAEMDSVTLCDMCGRHGTLAVDGAVMTRCEEHRSKFALSIDEYKRRVQQIQEQHSSSLPDDECQ